MKVNYYNITIYYRNEEGDLEQEESLNFLNKNKALESFYTIVHTFHIFFDIESMHESANGKAVTVGNFIVKLLKLPIMYQLIEKDKVIYSTYDAELDSLYKLYAALYQDVEKRTIPSKFEDCCI